MPSPDVPVEPPTQRWLAERFRTSVADEEARAQRVFDDAGQPCGVTPYAFRRLLRKLKIFRCLEQLEFDTLLDVASGWEHLPYLAHQRYGAEGFYSDMMHDLNLPLDGIHYGKLDHAVTLELPVLPFRDGAFDVVVCSEVLEHLVRPVEAIAELMRVARRYLILTSLEALSVTRWQRWLAHHRVDVRIPHVERNFFVMDELRALFGEQLHTENLLHDATLPVRLFEPVPAQRAAHAALNDTAALEAALCRAVSAGGHGPGAFGILALKAMPGAPLRAPDPSADPPLARWLIEQTAAEERFVPVALAVWNVFLTEPWKRPKDPAPDRPVAADLLTRLRCPRCRGALANAGAGARCTACGTVFGGDYGVPILVPGGHAAAVPTPEECLDRLCGPDAGRRRIVRRVMERLRRNETPPGAARRAAWRIERWLGGEAGGAAEG